MKPYDEHMCSCPKCGNYKILGPKYIAPAGGFSYERDRIKWECYDCHYTEYTETKDYQEKGEVDNKERGA